MKLYVFIYIFLCYFSALAQQPGGRDISIETGKKILALHEPFVLSVVVKNNKNRPLVTFPELEGLEKRSASATSITNTVGGTTVLIQTISQQYIAKEEGELVIPSFTVTVDGLKIKAEELTLLVKKGEKDLNSTESIQEQSEIISETDEASAQDVFLSLKTSKSTVYIREGFAVRLSLYVAKNAPINMEFYQLDRQMQSLLKKIRSATCWEENVGIEEVIQREVTINGRKYSEYLLYQAMLFPFTLQSVQFPSLSLDMLIPDAQKGNDSNKKRLQTFTSRAFRVLVKPLPPHPQRDQIAVGTYQLREKLTQKKVSSGESLRYQFTISGEGNLAAITAPEVPTSKSFDFYPPDLSQTIQRNYVTVRGEKTFDYLIVAKEKGQFPLGRFFQWIYFDPAKARYDTLRSVGVIDVVGENLKTVSLSSEGSDSIYENIEQLDTTRPYVDFQSVVRTLTNMVVIGLLGIMIWIFRK
ncbi:BatD family protein [Arundinibacter roseus]|uniref:Protein BatD n=1 Tax=Arundinibacter roseus TaxID=2070510 RepID=A0A4R4K2S0_9BACT|nr:BatD family protein [Arundinibacter roseus]TDB60842.1 hypothetical protein EZE20_20580 [Arundinibacter roseus]